MRPRICPKNLASVSGANGLVVRNWEKDALFLCLSSDLLNCARMLDDNRFALRNVKIRRWFNVSYIFKGGFYIIFR